MDINDDTLVVADTLVILNHRGAVLNPAQFSAAGATQFGSGWAWLSVNNATKKLEVSKTPNAENPWVHGQATPILTMDVWEHAYYVDQRNKRPDYIASFYSLINWDAVAARYAAAI